MARSRSKVTMMDVAREAGVSQSTVSFVVNGSTSVRISDATRQRVLEVAEALGYRRFSHSALDHKGSRVIGFLVDEISTSPFAVASMDGAREVAWENDRVLLVSSSGSDPELERSAIETLLSCRPEGMVIASILTRRIEPPAALRDVPTVLLNCYESDNGFPSVVPGEVAGGHTATRRLIDAGHRRIAIIGGEPWMEAARDRLKGYRQALATADIAAAPELIREGNWLPSSGYEQTRALMALDEPPTGIFCCNDSMAIGCYEALKEQGLRVPEDVSVVGYDDQEVARHMYPPLTTVVLPHDEMGRWAVETLVTEVASGQKPPLRRVKMECPLVERCSVAAPRVSSSRRSGMH
ncbi:LacI family DNA-binding transcriptional regulator [Salinisphaera sp.]|uniref:LacI family DNA-binding transcriptional regulator n=1 Tax=Salinisphaera sp. TaxID=1914330 RepID=UPI003C7D5D9E